MESNSNPYSELQMKESFVLFLDILGFSDMIRKAHKFEHENQLLKCLSNTLNASKIWFESWQPEDTKYKIPPLWAKKTFTDNIVIGYPIRNDGESESGWIFGSAAGYQFDLAMKGLFVRGGLSFGLHYMDDELVFGNALIDACELEKQANNPRIVLSDNVVKLVKSHSNHYHPLSFAPQNEELLIDEDGKWFLNYLSASIIEYNSEYYSESIKLLTIHKKQVIKKMNRYKSNWKIYSKYLWTAKYHNFFRKNIFLGNKAYILNSMIIVILLKH